MTPLEEFEQILEEGDARSYKEGAEEIIPDVLAKVRYLIERISQQPVYGREASITAVERIRGVRWPPDMHTSYTDFLGNVSDAHIKPLFEVKVEEKKQ